MRFQENQRNKIKEQFKEHVYYKVCKEVHRVFSLHCPSIILSPEELFADSVKTLDEILSSGDYETEQCNELWRNTYASYREKEGPTTTEEVSQAEVAMLLYTVMFGLQSVAHSHYRGTLQRVLHESVHSKWDKKEKNCQEVENKLVSVNQYTQEMGTWMEEYLKTTDSLTEQIEEILQPRKGKKANIRKDCSFKYDNKEYFAIAIQEFTNVLKRHNLIPDDVDFKQMESLFGGHSCRTIYTWLGEKHILTFIIKGLCDKGIVSTWPEGTTPWQVVSCRFVDKDGKPLPNIRSESERKKSDSVIQDAIDALTKY